MLIITPTMLKGKIKTKSENLCMWCLAANATGSRIMPEYKGDTNLAFLDFLRKTGCNIKEEKGKVPIVTLSPVPKETKFSADKINSFLLIAISTLSLIKGNHTIRNLSKLSQARRDTMFRLIGNLKKMGADILTDKDRLIINGRQVLCAAEVFADGNPEIFQTLMLASLKCEGKVKIKGADLIDKKDLLCLTEVYDKLTNQNKTKNIVLIGMSGAGKTTVAKLLSKQLEIPFFDNDEEFEKEEQSTINEVFSEKGEEYFRKRETEVLSKLSVKNGVIISTGGGIVEKKENIDILKKNGIIFYIERDINTIVNNVGSEERPLFKKGKAAVIKLFKSREAMYLSSADFKINNNQEPEKAADEIYKIFKEVTKQI